MREVAGKRRYDKKELQSMVQDAEVRLHVLETALRQIAEQPTDDPAALQQIASTALEKAAGSGSRL